MRAAIALLCAGFCAQAGAAGLDGFQGWIGNFERTSGSGRVLREAWVQDGSVLRGQATVQGPDGQWVVSEELLLVEIGTTVHYVAHPRENAYPTAFALVRFADGEAVFENLEHDFPQRIGYRVREGGLSVWIEGPGPQGAEPRRIPFEFERVE